MIDSKTYDNWILKSIITKNKIKSGTVYFGKSYEKKLRQSLSKKGITNKFSFELRKNKYGLVNMCSAASSARLCYFKFYSEDPNVIFEDTSLNNQGCNPHYDARIKNVFIECKCHEFLKKPGEKSVDKLLSKSTYDNLLKTYFKITAETKTIKCKDKYKDFLFPLYKQFGIHFSDNSVNTIYSQYFDFKQMLCHIFGLLTIKEIKPTLKYVFFVPKTEYILEDEKLNNWYKEFNAIIETIFNRMPNIPVWIDNKECLLGERINFEYEFCDVSTVNDFVIEKL